MDVEQQCSEGMVFFQEAEECLFEHVLREFYFRLLVWEELAVRFRNVEDFLVFSRGQFQLVGAWVEGHPYVVVCFARHLSISLLKSC